MSKFKEYKNYNHSQIEETIKEFWQTDHTFEKSISSREGKTPFIFYEGPPSANGMPGIHHLLSRTLKDIFCRYKTLQGYQVKRKAGWDTHGLPVEISVEKSLGITKEDIGQKISVEEYNAACRKDVLKFKDSWDEITQKMGYWLNLDDPYITFHNKYIESVWWLLKALYDKGMLYKGYTIQPYSPAAGTGLSTHELNQPGCYKDVKDTSAVAQFKLIQDIKSQFLFDLSDTEVYFLAWTTTPWTLPSNTALAVGKKIVYQLIKTINPYSGKQIHVILAKDLVAKYFPSENAALNFADYREGDKNIPFKLIHEVKGKNLSGIRFEQLLDFAQPDDGDAFVLVSGDFVTTEEGTGIVHIAPSFGADDMKVAKENGLGALTLVNRKGQFTEEMGEFAGRYVKTEYDDDYNPEKDLPVDVELVIKLKKENKLFKTEKYIHSYPHCWRTDKPILYYPLDSWFIRTTAAKERLIALNKTINWKPKSTGSGRFENWLENLVDWNLSRSRFWGTPLPIWRSEDGEEKCIGSLAELKVEIEKSVAAGLMQENPLKDYMPTDMSDENYDKFDLHRPYVDQIILESGSGKAMKREMDLIDVWFDSGSMPYAQFHFPFENKDIASYFPSDYISEGVDQTRGWFFTLHAIAGMVFDSVAYKSCLSHGLVLDKLGNKMSKKLGNSVDPFKVMDQYGADATRWYMITNAQVWENLKFDVEGVNDVRRKFFGTLYNTYSFFALYANIDHFTFAEDEIPLSKRPELDRWIISELNSLVKDVSLYYEEYDPTKAGRLIQAFVSDHLSNWYVRLSRRIFWKGEYSHDKISAYQTLYRCLIDVAKLISPIAPFFSEQIYIDLNRLTAKCNVSSVHLSDFPICIEKEIDKELEERMQIAQDISSMILSLRKKENIKVRQPLNKILIPIINKSFKAKVEKVRDIILSETNVKDIEYIEDTRGVIVKKIKPDFKKLGPKFGKQMKQLAILLSQLDQDEILKLENEGIHKLVLKGQEVVIDKDDLEILSEDIPGWLVANMGNLSVALDITISDDLKYEGLSREIVNRIQNLRKSKGFDVTDHIHVQIEKESEIEKAINQFKNYICSETLADKLEVSGAIQENSDMIEIDDLKIRLRITKV
ncbi:MAG: isoleucine--tRNA ligase [Bacteroidetes bacterium]|nr:isoleucine--tRNA ligase [Bacteroidota bacterium]